MLEENSTVVYTLSDLASSENESYRQIYELVKEYETVYGETKYEVSELHEQLDSALAKLEKTEKVVTEKEAVQSELQHVKAMMLQEKRVWIFGHCKRQASGIGASQ